MKQITEIHDPRLVKALAHPLRVQLLRVLQDRVASPSELAQELDARLPNVSYHVRVLERLGVIELVRTKPRRGAVEHYYQARGKLQFSDKAWAQVPEIVKSAMVAATLEQITQFTHTAASIGGFDHPHAHLSRRPMVLDSEGFAEIADALREFLKLAAETEAASAKRLATNNHQSEDIHTGLVMMLFEAPPASTGIPPSTTAKKPKRRTATRQKNHRR